MNTKYLFTAIAIVVIAVIGLFIYNQKNHKDLAATNSNTNFNANVNSNTADSNTNNANVNNANVESNSNNNTPTSASKETLNPDGNDTAVFQVNFDGKAFAPTSLKIKSGDVVIFQNNSSDSVWPASNPHPTHTDYPDFDPKKAIGPGQTWQFKFTKTGTWGYHDHLNPSIKGTITVQ